MEISVRNLRTMMYLEFCANSTEKFDTSFDADYRMISVKCGVTDYLSRHMTTTILIAFERATIWPF